MEYRVGQGEDIHRLSPGRRLILGGVQIEHDTGLVAHSDGDVLLHALTDALLGAAGLGDIGEWFPDTDEQWADADSAQFVQTAVGAVRNQRWEVVNLDCTLRAEVPKLTPYKAEIKRRIAELLGIDADRINIKAKTSEKVGPVGRREAIAASVAVLLAREEC